MSDFRMEAAVPAEMLARHADTLRLAVKRVEGLEVRQHDSTDFRERRRSEIGLCERGREFAEDPRPSLRGAADHDAIRAALFQRLQGLGRTIDGAIHEYRQTHGLLDGREIGRAHV